MGTLISLNFISSTMMFLKQILLARVPNKKEVQTPLLLTQRQPNSEDLLTDNRASMEERVLTNTRGNIASYPSS
jgi:hypothetical protein